MNAGRSNKQEWGGFFPVAYTLDSEQVLTLPIGLSVDKSAVALIRATPSTIGAVFNKLATEHYELEHFLPGLTVRTPSGEQYFGGPAFNLDLLYALLHLHKAGANAFNSRFFWYVSDSWRDLNPEARGQREAHSHSFFVVSYGGKKIDWRGGEIVEERIPFSDRHNGGFDASVFKPEVDEQQIGPQKWDWRQPWYVADTCFWYRKFYSETKTGQLMVLRPDKPELYYYPEGRRSNFLALPGINTTLFPKVYPGASRTFARFVRFANVVWWAFILTFVYIAVTVVHFMWNHPLF
jgi:hypothetical protein